MIQTRITKSVAWLQIDRPKQKNALSISLLEEILKKLTKYDADENIKVIIIHGNDNFSSGGDFNDMLVDNSTEAKQLAEKVQGIYFDISQIKKPLIAYTKGLVWGGGFELALVCDIIVSHSNSSFSFPEAALGIVPGGGGTQRLKNKIGKQNAAYILFSGESFSAERMLSLNLIQEITDDLRRVESIADTIAEKDTDAIKELKYLLKKDLDFKAESNSFSKLLINNGLNKIKSFLKKY